MKKLSRYPEITKEIIELLYTRMAPGQPITDEIWNQAYEIVWARHALATIDLKHGLLVRGSL